MYLAGIRLAGDALGAHEVLDLLTTQAVLVYACLVLLWGVGLLAREAALVRRDLAPRQPVPVDLSRA